MATARVGIVVGNGLAIDYHLHLGGRGWGLHPSSPTTWEFVAPADGELRWQQAFPHFYRERAKERDACFDAFIRILKANFADDFEADLLDTEARHFTALAYAHLQRQAFSLGVKGWAWGKWLRAMGTKVTAATSFNYDLLLEQTFDFIGRPTMRLESRS